MSRFDSPNVRLSVAAMLVIGLMAVSATGRHTLASAGDGPAGDPVPDAVSNRSFEQGMTAWLPGAETEHAEKDQRQPDPCPGGVDVRALGFQYAVLGALT